MGFNNPGISWGELERRLSDRPQDGRVVDPLAGDGGDSPAWSRKRAPYVAPDDGRRRGAVPYAELHCHSNYSFLDGASHPEELATEAARLGLEALALTESLPEIDAVLSDIVLEGAETGVDLLAALPDLPCVLMTSLPPSDPRHMTATRLGPVLRKPFDGSALHAALSGRHAA